MEKQANTRISILKGKEESVSKTDKGQEITLGRFEIEYQGEMEGKSNFTELRHYVSSNNASIFGLEYFKGKISGKSGEFIFEHRGEINNGKMESRLNIIQGSGSGELENIRGHADLKYESAYSSEIILRFDY